MATRGDPRVLSPLVVFLRARADMTQAEFGKASGVGQSDVSDYEAGKTAPADEVLRRMARVAGLQWWLVVHLRRVYEAVLSSSTQLSLAVDPETDLAAGLIEPALLAVTPYLIEQRSLRPAADEARAEAEAVWTGLEPLPDDKRRRLLGFSFRASLSWALAARICDASAQAAADKADRALELAKLALFVAQRVTEENLRPRAEGYCWAFIGNALRVANDFAGAGAAFGKAKNLWEAGRNAEECLPAWRLLDLEASLRRDQHHFQPALALLERARALAGGSPQIISRILLKREYVFERQGDLESALAVLAEATPFVEAAGDTRLLFALRFNTADNLCQLGRVEEAIPLVDQARRLAIELGNGLDSIRVRWLEGRVAAGLGSSADAEATFEEVRNALKKHKLPYDFAMASLDLAMIYREQQRWPEIQELAVQMVAIFRAHEIHREALAAVSLFQEAAAKQAVTGELVRQLRTYFEEARCRPGLRFEGNT